MRSDDWRAKSFRYVQYSCIDLIHVHCTRIAFFTPLESYLWAMLSLIDQIF